MDEFGDGVGDVDEDVVFYDVVDDGVVVCVGFDVVGGIVWCEIIDDRLCV